MDAYSSLTSWALFGGACVGLAYYYWPQDQRKQAKSRDGDRTNTAGSRRQNEQERRAKSNKRTVAEDKPKQSLVTSSTTAQESVENGKDASRKRKAPTKQPPAKQVTPSIVEPDNEPEEIDMSTKQFAQNFMQARKGQDLNAPKGKENRLRTVKQNSAKNPPVMSSGSSQAGAEADDDMSPAVSPAMDSGNVDDMLEPVAPGPSTLRLTASNQPQTQKAPRQPKEEIVESKKQRQNRKKIEERRVQREAEERERKVLEEKQRRAAREARGEPAKNGMSASRAPATNAWKSSTATPVNNNTSSAPTTNGAQNTPLLDTFDAESTGSSTGGLGASTAATSTTEAHEQLSEEDQVAMAMRQSEDESGWTTVAQPKKSKKQGSNGRASGTQTPVDEPTIVSTPKPVSKPLANGKPKGYQALDVQYGQRADADPTDASNWDA